ncbi:MAG: fructokinase [Deltaproteobacteria bacterium HGW-Deltaproteobacteria-14]|nr:MAG: fructokinase [Deltaproteobacteria bacterium HGW-Deltaproteobacteria-14]
MSGAAPLRIGVDLGGTKIEAVALRHGGEIALRRRIETPRDDYAAIVAAIAGLVRAVEVELGAAGSVGIGTPGAISPATGRMKNANTTCLNGRPLDKDLEGAIGRTIRVANDADCLALSEAADGAGRGVRSVFGVILGTGVGGGLVIDRQLVVGPNAVTGEWGHNPLPWPTAWERPGASCYCGRRGCVETFLCGGALTADFLARTGHALPAERVVALAEAGHPDADATLDLWLERLAKALASVINVLDPHIFVLGGGLSNIDRVYTEVPARWDRYAFSDTVLTRLAPARHGDSSGVLGAARLWDAPA